MKKLFTAILLFISAIAANASHITGAYMDYVYLGNSKYEITVTAYRDCNASGLSNPPVNIKCLGGSGSGTLALTKISSRDVTGLGANCTSKSPCSGGSYSYGLEECKYQGVLDLGTYTCCEVVLSWEQCCGVYSSNLTTASNFYIQATINKCAPSSMRWSDINPPYLLPVGTDQSLNFSANDTFDYDSLSYAFVPAMSGAGAPMSYAGNFKFNKPLSFLGFPNTNLNNPAGLQLDSVRGTMTFRPTKLNEIAVLAVEVTEWRLVGGVMTAVAKNMRQHTVTVISSNNNRIPKQTSAIYFNNCPGDTSVALVDFKDDDTYDSFKINFVHNLKWATAMLLGPQSRKILVLYLADSIPAGGLSNAFTIEVVDNACPLPGRSVKTYGLKTGGGTFIDSSYITKNINCGKASFTANNTKTGSNYLYSWIIKSKTALTSQTANTITATPSDTGWVKATLFVTSSIHCNYFEYNDSVYIDPANIVRVDAGKDAAVCNSAAVTFNATPVYGTGPFTYNWSNGAITQAAVYTPAPGISYATVTMTDSNGCITTDEVKIINTHPTITLTGATKICTGDTARLTGAVTNAIDLKFFEWDGFVSNIPTIIEKLTAPKQYTFKVYDGSCLTTQTYQVDISLPRLLITNPAQACVGDSVLLQAAPFGGEQPYSITWDTYSKSGPGIKISTANAAPGTSYFSVSVTDFLGCKGTANDSFLLNPLPVLTVSKINPICIAQAPFNLASSASPSGGIWAGPGVTANRFNPATAQKGLHRISYSYTQPSTGCSNSADNYLRVIATPVIDFTSDSTVITKGSAVQFTNTTVADSAFTSKWVISNSKGQSTAFSQNLLHTFTDTGLYTVTLVISPVVCGDDSLTKTNYIRVKASKTDAIHNAASSPVKIYPNPASDKVYIDAGDEILKSIIVTDITGKTITRLLPEANSIDIGTLARGVYFVQVQTEKGALYHAKIVIE